MFVKKSTKGRYVAVEGIRRINIQIQMNGVADVTDIETNEALQVSLDQQGHLLKVVNVEKDKQIKSSFTLTQNY